MTMAVWATLLGTSGDFQNFTEFAKK